MRANCEVSLDALAQMLRDQPSVAATSWLEGNIAGRSVKKSLRFETKLLRDDPRSGVMKRPNRKVGLEAERLSSSNGDRKSAIAVTPLCASVYSVRSTALEKDVFGSGERFQSREEQHLEHGVPGAEAHSIFRGAFFEWPDPSCVRARGLRRKSKTLLQGLKPLMKRQRLRRS